MTTPEDVHALIQEGRSILADLPPYIRLHNRIQVTPAGAALLLGVTTQQFLDEIHRQADAGVTDPVMPETWTRQGEQRRNDAWNALGYDAPTSAVLDWLAAREETPDAGTR